MSMSKKEKIIPDLAPYWHRAAFAINVCNVHADDGQ